jgi:glycosyltransferase involved in cell wall biosynthesis
MWFCSQIGAREHYAVPRVLHREGQLGALYTDFWAGAITRGMARQSHAKLFRSFATRFHPDLARAAITSWNARSLVWEASLRNQKKRNVYESFVKIGASFSACVRGMLSRRRDLNSSSIFFAYDTGALEAMEWCRERGLKCILNQMDPNRVEVQMVHEEEKLWPDWCVQSLEVPEEYFRRRELEWALADRIVVNSDFCRQALVQQGVPPEKLSIVPLCFEASNNGQQTGVGKSDAPGSKSKLRVLYLGQVILRKGIQYLVQAAKLLENEPVQFDVVGPVGISAASIACAPRNMVFHGRATRDQTARWYQQSDIFVLPTISDGFAITQLEAMSYGLPVVATPCCGTVVSDGQDGFVLPQRDVAALAKTFQRYLADPELLRNQRTAALAKVKLFTLNHLAANLCALEK